MGRSRSVVRAKKAWAGTLKSQQPEPEDTGYGRTIAEAIEANASVARGGTVALAQSG